MIKCYPRTPVCALALILPSVVGVAAGTVLLDEQFPDTNRFNGTLPESARWVQNATTVEGGAATATIVENELLGGKALRVANVGWLQWTSAAIPLQELVDVGDQIKVSFDILFPAGGLKDRDQGFVFGFLDQLQTPIATLDVSQDFGNFGTGRSNNWNAYFLRLATGTAGSSIFGKRAPADSFQAWWLNNSQIVRAFSGSVFSQTDRVYEVTTGIVLTGENELTGYLDIPGVLGERRLFVDAAPITRQFDGIAFRAEYNLDEDPEPPVYYVSNIRVEFIPQGPMPGEIPDPVDPVVPDRGTAPEPVIVETLDGYLGEVRTDLAPWFDTEVFGWVFGPNWDGTAAGWLYVPTRKLGWVYLSGDLYPWYYSVAIGGWVHAFEDFVHEDARIYSAVDNVISVYPLQLRDVYVAPWGDDDNDGSYAMPLRNISRALTSSEPGDTIHVRAGTYEESLTLRNRHTSAARPITVTAYMAENGPEAVTLSALAPVTPGENGFGNWEHHEGSIYKIRIPASQTLNGSKTLVFANGEVMTPARFPDSVDFWQVRREDMLAAEELITGEGGRRSYRHSQLAGQPAGAWRGAYIHFFPGLAWYEAYRIVETSVDDRIEFIPPSNPLFNPVAGDLFYLYDTLTALTQPGEFFFDWRGNNGPSHTLYVWMPDGSDPAGHAISYRAREYSVLSTNVSHHNLRHMTFIGGWSRFLAAASDIEMDHIQIYFGGFNNEFWAQEAAVDFRGPRSVFRNGSILYSRGFNIRAESVDQVVENSVLGFGNWGNVEGHGLDGTYRLTVRGNTIFSAAGVNVNINGWRSHYTMNHVYGGGYAATDIANMNAHGGEDALGTVVSYNWVHGAYGVFDEGRPGHNGGFGIRVDAGEAVGNFRIFRNVVWDVTRHDISVWGLLTPNAQLYGNVQNFVYHNTVEDEIAVAPRNRGNPRGTYLWNNIMLGSFDPIYNPANPDTVFDFNVVAQGSWGPTNHIGDPRVRDFANQDFTLMPDSPAINFGRFIDGYTVAFTGEFPDAGAYEFGLPAWYPGARVRAVDLCGLYLEADEQGGSRVMGIPLGRKPTDGFSVRMGSDGPALPVRHVYNSITHHAEVFVDALPGDAYFSLDGTTFVRGAH